MRRSSSRNCAAAVLALVAVAGCGRADIGASDKDRTRAPVAATTRPEARALAQALARRLEAPAAAWQPVRAGGGHEILRAGGRLRQVTVVGRAADGSLRLGCVSSAAEAEAVLVGDLGRGGGRR